MKISCTLAEWFAFGPRLVNMGYIAKVTIEGKYPRKMQFPGDATEGYHWFVDRGDHRSEDLPPELTKGWIVGSDSIQFPTVKEAAEWLSKVCIHWAKIKVNEEANVS